MRYTDLSPASWDLLYCIPGTDCSSVEYLVLPWQPMGYCYLLHNRTLGHGFQTQQVSMATPEESIWELWSVRMRSLVSCWLLSAFHLRWCPSLGQASCIKFHSPAMSPTFSWESTKASFSSVADFSWNISLWLVLKIVDFQCPSAAQFAGISHWQCSDLRVPPVFLEQVIPTVWFLLLLLLYWKSCQDWLTWPFRFLPACPQPHLILLMILLVTGALLYSGCPVIDLISCVKLCL